MHTRGSVRGGTARSQDPRTEPDLLAKEHTSEDGRVTASVRVDANQEMHLRFASNDPDLEEVTVRFVVRGTDSDLERAMRLKPTPSGRWQAAFLLGRLDLEDDTMLLLPARAEPAPFRLGEKIWIDFSVE